MKILKGAFIYIIAFCFICEQTGFAQTAGQVDISAQFQRLSSVIRQQAVFQPGHLRSISYTHEELGLFLDPGAAGQEPDREALRRYFLTGLALPDQALWVNLRPDAPEAVIDPALARTDLGKVMLAADLRMKKDLSGYTSPDTPTGKEYWKRLHKKAEELFGGSARSIPTLARPCIVPGEILLRESGGSVYIYKARLEVRLESDHLKDAPAYEFKDSREKTLNDYAAGLVKELIIPRLTREINTGKKYAGLRQGYYSLILAQWFKRRFRGARGSYPEMIDSGALNGISSAAEWDPQAYFNDYRKSFTDGEYSTRETAYTGAGQSQRTYFSGGIAPVPAIPPAGTTADNVTVFKADAGTPLETGLVPLSAAPAGGKKDGGLSGRIPALAFNSAERFNALLKQREGAEEFRTARDRWLSGGAFGEPVGAYKEFISSIARRAEQTLAARFGTVHYYPMGGFDSAKPFWLSPSITDVICVDRQRFGTPVDLNAFLADAIPSDMLYYTPFESENDMDRRKERYGLSGTGVSAALRIRYYLGAEITGIYYFTFDPLGLMRFARESREGGGEYPNAVIEFTDPASGTPKRYWHINENLDHPTQGFRFFLAGLEFQSLQLNGAYNAFDRGELSVNRANAIDAIVVPARQQQEAQGRKVIVLTDHAFYGPAYHMWQEQPHSIALRKGERFGYSNGDIDISDNSVYFGSADMLVEPPVYGGVMDGGKSNASAFPRLKAEITWNSAFSVPGGYKKQINEMIAWERVPNGKGRSGILVLGRPVEVNATGKKITIKAIKVKGIGAFDTRGPQQPVAEKYETTAQFHIVADKAGKLFPVEPEPTPVGGLAYERAHNEFRVLETISAIKPGMGNVALGYGVYPEMRFNGGELGFVIEGVQDPQDLRFDEMIAGASLWLKGGIKTKPGDGLFARLKGATDRASIVSYILKCYEEWGKSLRTLNDAGILHLRTHSGNWSVNDDGSIVIHDFDSAVSANQLSPEQSFITRLHPELSGAVRDIHADLYQYDAVKLLVAGGGNPYAAFLKGYFGEDAYNRWGDVRELAETLVQLPPPTPATFAHQRFQMSQLSAHYLMEALSDVTRVQSPFTLNRLETELDALEGRVMGFQDKKFAASPEKPGIFSRLASIFSGGAGTSMEKDAKRDGGARTGNPGFHPYRQSLAAGVETLESSGSAGRNVSMRIYQEDIERARQGGKIIESGPKVVDFHSPLELSEINTRNLYPNARKILETLIMPGRRAISAMVLGPGSGRECWDIKELAAASKAVASVSTAGLSPIAPSIRLTRNANEIHAIIFGLVKDNAWEGVEGMREYLAPTLAVYKDPLAAALAATQVIPLRLALSVQARNPGYDMFERLDEPYIDEQFVGPLISLKTAKTYDFLYDNRGAFAYTAQDEGLQAAYKAALPLIKDEGILDCEWLHPSVFPQFKSLNLPEGYFTVFDPSSGALVAFHRNSRHGVNLQKMAGSLRPVGRGTGIFTVDDFGGMLQRLGAGTGTFADGGRKLPAMDETGKKVASAVYGAFNRLDKFSAGDRTQAVARAIFSLAVTRDFDERAAARDAVNSAVEVINTLGDGNPFTEANLRMLDARLAAGKLALLDGLQFGDLMFVLSAFSRHGATREAREHARQIGERLARESGLTKKEAELVEEFRKSSARDGGTRAGRDDARLVREGHYLVAKTGSIRFFKSYKLYDCVAMCVRDPVNKVSGLAHMAIGMDIEASVQRIYDDLFALGADLSRVEITLAANSVRDSQGWQLIRDIRAGILKAGLAAAKEELVDLAPGESSFNIIFDAVNGTYDTFTDAPPADSDAAGLSPAESLALYGKPIVRQPAGSALFDLADAVMANSAAVYPVSGPAASVYLTRDHNLALGAWEMARLEGKIRDGAALVHFDAHDDFRDNVTPYRVPSTLDDVRALSNYNIEQFIAPAVARGLISEIYWVIPGDAPQKPQGRRTYYSAILAEADGTRRVYFDTRDPRQGIPGRYGRVQSITEVRPISVHEVYLADLPDLREKGPAIVDLDADYFSYKKRSLLDARAIQEEMGKAARAVKEKIVAGVTNLALSPGYTRDAQMDLITAVMVREFLKTDAPKVSSPVRFVRPQRETPASLRRDGGNNPGGIDFRSLPVAVAAVDPARFFAPGTKADGDMEAEWQAIQQLVNRGIVPSCERLKEYMACCYRSGSLSARTAEILSCLARVLRLQEASDLPTEPLVGQLLALLESP